VYLKYFGLKKPPFRITPDTDSFYTGGERGPVFRALKHAILAGEPIIKVIGEVGSGKTMLCRMLESDLANTAETAYIPNPRLSAKNILHAIALELNLTIPITCNRLLLLKTINEYLVRMHLENKQVVVLVEEAQSMPLDSLEELRLLGNLETKNCKLLQIVLFAQPELDESLSQNHVRQIRDRITQCFYLKNLNDSEISDYLLFRLYSSGYQGQHLFTKCAIRKIRKHSQGLLRRINILADKSLMSAYNDSKTIVGRKQIIQAINDSSYKHKTNFVLSNWLTPVLSFAFVFSLGAGLIHYLQLNETLTFIDVNQLPPTQAGFPAKSSSKNEEINKLIHRQKNFYENFSKKFSNPNIENKPLNIIALRLKQSQKWINSANPNHFSIQVLMTDADSVAGLERFLRQKEMAKVLGRIYIYHTKIRGIPMTGVLYGEYTSYSDARRALTQLPAPLRRYQPYVRNIRNVIAEKLSNSNGLKRDSS